MTDQTVPVIRVVQHAKFSAPTRPTVDFTLGLPGCGKSTWTRAEWDADPTIVVINNDNLGRAMSRHRTKENGALLAGVRATALNLAIDQGRRVIVDNTNLSPWIEKELRKQFPGATLEVVVFDTSFDECVRRNALREGIARVPDGAMLGMASKWSPEDETDQG